MDQDQFELLIAEGNLHKDPLDNWMKYLDWLEKVTGPKSDHVKDLLERCTSNFIDDSRYVNDKRLLHADAHIDPVAVFGDLVRLNIGSTQALRYVAHSATLERAGDHQGAEQVFRDAVAIGAKPTEVVQKRQEEFLHRMKQRELREQRRAAAAKKSSTPAPASTDVKAPQRGMDVPVSEIKPIAPTSFALETPIQAPKFAVFNESVTESAVKPMMPLETPKAQPGKFAIFSENVAPAKQPLAPSQQETVPSSSAPQKFAIFSENTPVPVAPPIETPKISKFAVFNENAPPEVNRIQSTASAEPIKPAGKFSIFSESMVPEQVIVARAVSNPLPVIAPLETPKQAPAKFAIFSENAPPSQQMPLETPKQQQKFAVFSENAAPELLRAQSTSSLSISSSLSTPQPAQKQPLAPRAALQQLPSEKPTPLQPRQIITTPAHHSAAPVHQTPSVESTPFTKEKKFKIVPSSPTVNTKAALNFIMDAFTSPSESSMTLTPPRSMSKSRISYAQTPKTPTGRDRPPVPPSHSTFISTPSRLSLSSSQVLPPSHSIHDDIPSAIRPSVRSLNISMATPMSMMKTPAGDRGDNVSFCLTPDTMAVNRRAPLSVQQTIPSPKPMKLSLEPYTSKDEVDDLFDLDNSPEKSFQAASAPVVTVMNPYESTERLKCLQAVSEFVGSLSNYTENQGVSQLELIKGQSVDVGNCSIKILRIINPTTYLVEQLDGLQPNQNPYFTLKAEKSTNVWEFYICTALDDRLSFEIKECVTRARELRVFRSQSLLFLGCTETLTLQDAIISHNSSGGMPEPLALYYAIEMLRVLECIHAVKIIHADVRASKFLLRVLTNESSLGYWSADRDNGWSELGLRLTGFGRSVDTQLYPDKTCFVGDSSPDILKCTEMTNGRPWTYQIDLYGVCDAVHMMMHGRDMEVIQQKSAYAYQSRWKPKLAVKKGWRTTVWDSLFDKLLNIPSCATQPNLAVMRRDLEMALSVQAKEVTNQMLQERMLMSGM